MRQISEDLLASLVSLAGDAIIAVDGMQRVVIFNHAAERLFDQSATHMLGGPLDPVLPNRFREAHRGHIRTFEASKDEARFMGERTEIIGLRGGEIEFPAEATISRQATPGGVYLTAILRDISQRKQNEVSLKAALDENKLMLEELRHRIHNSLQTINSLMELQIRRARGGDQAKAELQDLRNRIEALDLMYRSLDGELDRISAAAYIHNLAAHLQLFFAEPQTRVTMMINIDGNLMLTSRQATFVGLILNEIVTNSFKYAFPAGREGMIQIDLRQHLGGRVRLMAGDNGVGWPDKASRSQNDDRAGLGLSLIAGLVKGLGGQFRLERTPSARYEIEWPRL